MRIFLKTLGLKLGCETAYFSKNLHSVSVFLCVLSYAASTGCSKTPEDISFVLVGERHGVTEHQQATANVISKLANSEKKVGVVMEMLREDQAVIIKAFRVLSPNSADDLGYAIEWDKTGWPDYKLYAPIFNVVWEKNLGLAVGDPKRSTKYRWRRGQWEQEDFDPKSYITQKYSLDLANKVQVSWMNSMQEAHCGQLEDDELKDLARMQMMRDAYMAKQIERMQDQGYDTVVLVAGRAHTRHDRGVPLYLKDAESAHIIAMIERDSEEENKPSRAYQPASVHDNVMPYDEIILTPAIDVKESSSCERARAKGLIK